MPTTDELARDVAALKHALLVLGDRVQAFTPAADGTAAADLTPEELLRDGVLTVAAAVAGWGLSDTEVRALLRSGEVASFKRGSVRLIPRRSLVLYFAGLYRDHLRTPGGG